MLLMEHPQAAALPCSECQEFIYNIETGKVAMRGGQPQKRLPNQPTPCRTCPKESPARAKELELSERARQTVELYMRHRAMGGGFLTAAEAGDSLLQRNFALIDSVFRWWERRQQTDSMATAFAGLFRGR